MPFDKEARIREATVNDVGWFFRKASEKDWHGIIPAFIDTNRLAQCDGFLVAEYEGEVIGAVASSSKGMDGSTLPTIANLYVFRDSTRKGIGLRLFVQAMKRLLASGSPKVFCKAITNAMVRTIEKLPADMKQRLEYLVDLDDMVEAWELMHEMRETE